MSVAEVLLPVFVLVALTFTLMFWMGTVRYRSVNQRETRISDVALGQLGEFRQVRKLREDTGAAELGETHADEEGCEDGDRGGIGAAAERDDETARAAFAQVVKQS